MGEFDVVLKELEKAARFGEDVAESGARLIGHTPDRGSHAYLHVIYPPISMNELAGLERELGRKLPTAYHEFLSSVANGLNIYAGSLSLYGLRKSNARLLENRQPYSIVRPNQYEKPEGLADECVLIGTYDWDGSKLFMTETGQVCRCPRYEAAPVLNRWRNLSDMLSVEVKRLSKHFDETGREIDEDNPTTP